ncbi:MAG: tetratricopeptide repeat protein [Acidobacteriota bacterium]|nr:tetratricopeptide repeat protein [Acidobacteriota bacterium]
MYSLLAALLMVAAPDNLQQRSELAKRALLSGKAAEAVTRYRALVKELPSDAGMRLNLALAFESAATYTDEIEQLELVLKQKPEMFAAWLLLGMAHQKMGQPAAAIDPLRRALTLSPGDNLALLELGDAHLAVGDLAEAAKFFKELVARDPNSAKGWKGLALTYTAKAREDLARLQRAAPDSAEWFFLAAQSELDDTHFTRAFGLLREAAKRQPELRGVHEALSKVYDKTGHPDWAATERQREASANRNSRQRDFLEADKFRKLAAEALAQMEQLPESAELLELRAESDQRQGRRAEALAEWRRAVALTPADRRLLGKLAESLWINRSYEEAEPLLARLVAANPREAQWQYLLGDVLFRERRSEAARPHLEAAIRLNDGLLEAHAVLGRIYLQLGAASKAIPHLLKGLPTGEAAILFQLGQAYRATGQAELAAKAFERQQDLLQTPPEQGQITAPDP